MISTRIGLARSIKDNHINRVLIRAYFEYYIDRIFTEPLYGRSLPEIFKKIDENGYLERQNPDIPLNYDAIALRIGRVFYLEPLQESDMWILDDPVKLEMIRRAQLMEFKQLIYNDNNKDPEEALKTLSLIKLKKIFKEVWSIAISNFTPPSNFDNRKRLLEKLDQCFFALEPRVKRLLRS